MSVREGHIQLKVDRKVMGFHLWELRNLSLDRQYITCLEGGQKPKQQRSSVFDSRMERETNEMISISYPAWKSKKSTRFNINFVTGDVWEFRTRTVDEKNLWVSTLRAIIRYRREDRKRPEPDMSPAYDNNLHPMNWNSNQEILGFEPNDVGQSQNA